MPIIHLTIGSNLGDRFANLQAAIAAHAPAVRVLSQSPYYEMPPWGLTGKPGFLNMVLKVEMPSIQQQSGIIFN